MSLRMRWILANKKYFIATEVVSILLLFSIFKLSDFDESLNNQWYFIASICISFIAVCAFFPLCYLSWFKKPTNGIYHYLKLSMFWVGVFVSLVIFVGVVNILVTNT